MKPPGERASLLRRALVLPISLYRRYLSRFKPPMCRFHPTCSAYAQEAILTHGPLRGIGLAIWRIMRCQPFAKGGLDPVPPARRKGESNAAGAGAPAISDAPTGSQKATEPAEPRELR